MLSSKDILERTGLSRATLNNYIAAGLVVRPDVLPPGPNDGGSPRLGYFPDETIERLETIQRLKREGWSLGRIVEHFNARGPEEELAPPLARESVRRSPPATNDRAARVSPAAMDEPRVVVVAAMAVELHDADELWVALPVQDYFAFSVDFEAEVRGIVSRYRGQATRLAPYRFLCQFLAGGPFDALEAALEAAKALRMTLAGLTVRWKLLRQWDLDIQFNSGLAVGEAWIGGGRQGDVQVMGDVGSDALQLARWARKGTLLLTRDFVGRLPAVSRESLIYAVPSSGAADAPHRLMTFSRLRSMGASVHGLPRRVADMAVAEFIESPADKDVQ